LREVNGKKGVFEASAPPDVVNGKQAPVDPNSIGNGSIANIRIFQYDYTFEGKQGIATSLQGIQLVRHVLYTPKPIESFDEVDTEVIIPPPETPGGVGAAGSENDGDDGMY
jgi:hypothetical protein